MSIVQSPIEVSSPAITLAPSPSNATPVPSTCPSSNPKLLSSLKFYSRNARSLVNKLSDFQSFMYSFEPAVIAMNETLADRFSCILTVKFSPLVSTFSVKTGAVMVVVFFLLFLILFLHL